MRMNRISNIFNIRNIIIQSHVNLKKTTGLFYFCTYTDIEAYVRFSSVLPERTDCDMLERLVFSAVFPQESRIRLTQDSTMKQPTRTLREKLVSILGYGEVDSLVILWKDLIDAWNDVQTMKELMSEEHTRIKKHKLSLNTQRTIRDTIVDYPKITNTEVQDKAFVELQELHRKTIDLEKETINYLGFLQERHSMHRVSTNRSQEVQDDSNRNALIEIRPGLGSLDAVELVYKLEHLYSRFCKRNHWDCHRIESETNKNGILDSIAIEISGTKSFDLLRSEAGIHRFIHPSINCSSTIKQSRVFTSTVLVSVLPEADPFDDSLLKEDIEIQYLKYGGPGGTQGTKSSSHVAVLHKPTGMRASCKETRSNKINLAKAMTLLRSRVLELRRVKLQTTISAAINEMLGTRESADRIRTYDFVANKITDHRCKMSLNNLSGVMETGAEFGDLVNRYKELRLIRLASTLLHRIFRVIEL